MSIYKLPRITTFAEEAKRFEKLPSPGQYHKELKHKPPGAFKLKEERISFIDQALYDGLTTPAPYEAPKLVRRAYFPYHYIGDIQAQIIGLEDPAIKEAPFRENRAKQ